MATQQRERRLSDQCQFLKGVGPAKAIKLRNLGIETVHDLLVHFPRKYYDRRTLTRIAELRMGEEATFVGQVLSVGQPGSWRRRGRATRVTAAIGDDTGIVQVVWFNQPYLGRRLKAGMRVLASGELSLFRNQRQVVNPEFELADGDGDDGIHGGRIVPVYPLTSGVTQRYLRELLARVLDMYDEAIYDNLPPTAVEAASLCDRRRALRGIHFPDDARHFEDAVRRLKFEELFFMQLVLSLQRRERRRFSDRPRFTGPFELADRFLAGLPFELTGAQQRVLEEMHADFEGDRGLHRLLQGDVGSGKTIVAGAAMLCAVQTGFQAALMVPTEILAVQHARTLVASFDPLGIPVDLLIGSLKAAEKRALHKKIGDGSARVVVGTHALIQDQVQFKKLGLVVIDEQHRFGVRQRAALMSQSGNPHMLVMTATPIPRTLALTAYADLDLSVIDEMPRGRPGITTRIVTPEKRPAMYEYIRDQVELGRRAYLLYPLIDETEKQDVEAAVSAFEELKRGVLADVPVGLLHGRMSFTEKEQVMRMFSSGHIKVLVTTTVVEVGVHVPEATIMAIHHPERFGLSQLHQLRGRVGRGDEAGYCFLLAPDGGGVFQRLRIMTRVSDGFKIAEEDLKIRGPGEFFGTRQHGVPGLKLANPAVDGRLVETAQRQVKNLLEGDALRAENASGCRRFLHEVLEESIAQLVG